MVNPPEGSWRSPRGGACSNDARWPRDVAGSRWEGEIALFRSEKIARGARGWGGRLTAEPDERAGRRCDRRAIGQRPMGRDDPESDIRRRIVERDPLVGAIAAVEAVEPLLRGRGRARLREPKPSGPDRIQPLEGGIARTIGRAVLRSLGGRDEDRPHDQDREDRSKEQGFHDRPPIASEAMELLFTNPD